MRFRALTAAALAASLALAAAACSGDDEAGGSTGTGSTAGSTAAPGSTSASTSDAPDEGTDSRCPVDELAGATAPVEVELWHAMNAELETALTDLIATYQQQQQDRVRVKLVNQVGYEENLDKYRAASAGDRPDLVQLPEWATRLMVDSRTAVPVQECIDAAGYDLRDHLPSVTAAYTVDGVLWPMPFNVSNPVLYYNRAAFERAGLDPAAPPRTLEELRQASEAIVSSGAARYGLAVDTGFESGGGWFVEQWFAQAGELYAEPGNGRAEPATSVRFDEGFGAELLGFLQAMVADGLAVNVGENPTGRDTLLKLIDPGQPAAMTIHTSAALSSVLAILAGGAFPGVELGVGPMPGPAPDGGVLVGGAALWLPAGDDPLKVAAAWDVARWLAEPEQQAVWSTRTGYVPLRRSAVDLPAVQQAWASRPEYRVAYDQLVATPPGPAGAGPLLGPQRQVREIVAGAVAEVLNGADPADALADAAAEADDALADYARRTGG